jgi:hypothetical protein
VLKVPPALAMPEALSSEPPLGHAPGEIPSFLRMPAAPAGGHDALSADIEAELAATAKYGEEDPTQPDPKRDLHVPVALIVVGFLLTVADLAVALHVHPGLAVAAGVVGAGVKLVVGMVLMLGGALVAAKFAGINFGLLGPALLKLAGLCLAPSALGDLTTTLLGGDAAVAQIGWVVRVVLYWAFVSYLFRLDGGQTAIVVGTITIVKVVTVVLLGSLLLIAVAPPMPGAGGFSDDESGREADLRALDAEFDALDALDE